MILDAVEMKQDLPQTFIGCTRGLAPLLFPLPKLHTRQGTLLPDIA